MEEYQSSGEGYWHNRSNPSKSIYGISPEIEEEINENWRIDSFSEERRKKTRIAKAMNLIRESGARDINYKIYLLRKLDYSQVKTRRGLIKFEKVNEIDYPNITRMYETIIQELRDIVKNPDKKTALINRLDSLQ